MFLGHNVGELLPISGRFPHTPTQYQLPVFRLIYATGGLSITPETCVAITPESCVPITAITWKQIVRE